MNDVLRRLPAPIQRVTGDFFPAGPNDKSVSLWTWLRAQVRTVRGQLFIVVVIPTIVASIYFGLIASRRYTSEGEFIVRGVSTNHAGGLSSILQTFGISRAADDTAAVEDFIRSRDAVRELSQRVDLRSMYGHPGIDFLSRSPRFWESDSFETLYNTFQRYVTVKEDTSKGLTTLTVEAFSPNDARVVAQILVQLAEGMVNRMNGRAQHDTINNAVDEVTRAEKDVAKAQDNLTAFRNKQLIVDPTSYSQVLLASVNKLSTDLVQTIANQKATLRMSPENPALPSLDAQVTTLNEGIEAERRKLGGSETALAASVSEYEKMTLLRDLAGKRYAQALLALENAQQEAHRQQIYIEEVIRPNLPDEDSQPERLRMISTVAVLSFAAFAMIWIITVGAKDHAQ